MKCFEKKFTCITSYFRESHTVSVMSKTSTVILVGATSLHCNYSIVTSRQKY